jgi:alpha-1,3/alpha-1,6-mannosyltransferase
MPSYATSSPCECPSLVPCRPPSLLRSQRQRRFCAPLQLLAALHVARDSHRCFSYVPFMRLKAKVMFYCHYPDKLLAPKGGLMRRLYRQLAPTHTNVSFPPSPRSHRVSLFPPHSSHRPSTRIPFDFVEERCTLAANAVVVNSNFTAGVFVRAFAAATSRPEVLYPCVTLAPPPPPDDDVMRQLRGQVVFVSINRLERPRAVLHAA